ncbi:Nonspecific acid phosphatase [Lysobacter dokdonensis DS-58]|uniref:Nonspecific acid phosphatase n=1 Tax=Lysobacter dokdonensis DS-58 TaxID=1300345 RepID=A0A0A2X2H3_9GAMM|nr:HAD family hydrolase [Lysobacter dokdonensis]KGQ19439.1 Nonspecific acid phosphatase [Lysobacter dokdonensis DS-58]
MSELPSWSDSAARRAIVDFVRRTTTPGGPDFVAPAERIAVFDNDGTLWSEQPMYFQFLFALDRVRALAGANPEWATTTPFKWVLDGDMKALAASGEKGLMPIVAATHAGMTTDAFGEIVREWMAQARHPTTRKPYHAMVFQPMQELMAYLRANGYGTWIVSGGGQEFLRAWVESVYGVPPQQVIGSYAGLHYEGGDAPSILKTAQPELVDDHAGKPVGIQRFSSAGVRSWRSATPTAISRCSNGRRVVQARVTPRCCITPMACANSRTTANRRRACSPAGWTKPPRADGP